MNLQQTPKDVHATRATAVPIQDVAAPGVPSAACPYRVTGEAVASGLGSDVAFGLTRVEAQRRLEQYGPNQLKSAPETPWWRRLIEQFENVLVIILLIATVISML